jgi:hypothetical protein
MHEVMLPVSEQKVGENDPNPVGGVKLIVPCGLIEVSSFVTVAVQEAGLPSITDSSHARAIETSAGLTVKVAASLVTDPQVLENTARYWVPLLITVGVVLVNVAPPEISTQVPVGVLDCHLTKVGVGVPVADAVNIAFAP